MAASPSRSSSSTAETKKFAQRSWLPASAASTGAMSPCPSPPCGWRLRAPAGRARPPPQGSSASSPLSRPSKADAKRALLRAMRPVLSTVAIAIGVFWKKRMKRTSAARCGSLPSSLRAVEHQRARGAGRAVGAERHFVEQAHRHRLAAARLEIEVEHLGLHFAGRGIERGEQRGALAGDDIGELERAGADLRRDRDRASSASVALR